jgi:beta-lactamase class A
MSINKKLLIIFLGLLFMGVGVFIGINHSGKYKAQVMAKAENTPVHNANTQLPYTFLNNVIAQSGAACSVYYKSLTTDQLFYNYSGQMPAASLIKVFILAEAMDEVKAGNYKLEDEYKIKGSDIVEGSPALQNKQAGTKISFGTLLEKMITVNDNTATNMLIDILGMDTINEYIQAKGYEDTVLSRKMMEVEAQKAGKENYTSVNDLVNIFERLYNNKCVSADYDKKMLQLLKEQKANNKIPALLPKNIIIAHTDGDLPGVQNDCGIVYAKENYILAIMTDGSIDKSKTLKTINQISSIIYNSVVDKEVFQK